MQICGCDVGEWGILPALVSGFLFLEVCFLPHEWQAIRRQQLKLGA